MRYIAIACGAILLILVSQDAFEVMLLPRRVHRRLRLTRIYFLTTWKAWSQAALLFERGARREGFLGVFGPLSMLGLFALWAASLITAFGLIGWALQEDAFANSPSPLGEQIYMSGVTFFTLGYGDVVPRTPLARFVAVLEAGTGIGFIAVVIGYLPVLYQLFSRREAHVLQLDARAGTPASAITMLKRHAESGGLGKLDLLLREWEKWGAELLESHLSYPMLVYYRSQHHDQSWLASIATIMDTCALILVGIENLPALQARMTFSLARQVIVEMSRSLAIRPSRLEHPQRLPHAHYVQMEKLFVESGIDWNGGPTAEETLSALRATYEPFLTALATDLLLELPSFFTDAASLDYWEQGPRGLVASRLVEELAKDAKGGPGPHVRSGRLWRRLRSRLLERGQQDANR